MKNLLKFICLFIVLTEFNLLNLFSQQADAGPDTTICSGNRIKIGSAIYDPSWCFSWLPDDNSLTDKRSPEPIAYPSVTTTYILKVVGPDFSFTSTDDMVLKIINPDITFKEHPDQKYGFDNYHRPYTPWKSVKIGDNDIVITEIKPATDYKHIFFKSSDIGNISFTPSKATSDKQEITVTGVSKGTADLEVHGDEENGVKLGDMHVASYNELSKLVAIILISEENDDDSLIGLNKGQPDQTAIDGGDNKIIDSYQSGDDEISGSFLTTGADGICQSLASGDDVQIIPPYSGKPDQICIVPGSNKFRDTNKSGDDEYLGDSITTGPDGICSTVPNNLNKLSKNVDDTIVEFYLNKVYSQAIVSWTMIRLSDCVVNYDLDRNDTLDVTNWMTDEMRAIRDKCGNLLFQYNIFLVNNPNNTETGVMEYGSPYGFVHADKSPFPEVTISHELGHGAFRLVHDPDSDNIMYYELRPMKWRLNKEQWDKINP